MNTEARTQDQKKVRLGNRRLLNLAAYVARRQAASPAQPYDQYRYTYECGAPACLVGHEYSRGKFKVFNVKNCPCTHREILDRYAISEDQAIEIFGRSGCSYAGEDWRKAVKYVRDFVALRGGV